MNTERLLIPEFAPQDAVLIAWPTAEMDWAHNLPEVEATYTTIAQAILQHAALIVVTSQASTVRERVGDNHPHALILVDIEANDTWARDFAPLSCRAADGGKEIVDFGFNAWGMKFAANHDNQIGRALYFEHALFADDVRYLNALSLVCEGGALETDGHGTLLSTASVLNEPNRNPGMTAEDQHDLLREILGTPQLFVSEVDALPGDDTDGHIDTLARFCDEHTIVYHTTTPNDPRYRGLHILGEELSSLTDIDGSPYHCVPLPLPSPLYDSEGAPLPATYANFLIVNDAVLMPIYHTPEDAEAIKTITELFPSHQIYPIDCRPLVQQHGSLHCITMQFPAGFINPDYL